MSLKKTALLGGAAALFPVTTGRGENESREYGDDSDESKQFDQPESGRRSGCGKHKAERHYLCGRIAFVLLCLQSDKAIKLFSIVHMRRATLLDSICR